VCYDPLLKETLVQASWDAKMMVRKPSKRTLTLEDELSQLFDSADMSGDGMVTQKELHNISMLPQANRG